MKATNKSMESMSKFTYCGKTEVFRNCVHEECLPPFDWAKSFVLPPCNFKTINIEEADPGGRAVSAAASFAGIAGSNPAENMDIRLLCLLCVV